MANLLLVSGIYHEVNLAIQVHIYDLECPFQLPCDLGRCLGSPCPVTCNARVKYVSLTEPNE